MRTTLKVQPGGVPGGLPLGPRSKVPHGASCHSKCPLKFSSRMAEFFSPAEVAEFAAAFKLFGDGVEVETSKLGTMLRALGQNPTPAEVKDLVKALDLPEDRTAFNLPEFMRVVADKFAIDKVEVELRRAFDVFDKDGDGSIAAPEVFAVMKSLGEPLPLADVENMIRELADPGASPAAVTFEQFARIVSAVESRS